MAACFSRQQPEIFRIFGVHELFAVSCGYEEDGDSCLCMSPRSNCFGFADVMVTYVKIVCDLSFSFVHIFV